MIIRRQRKDDALELHRGKRVEVVLEKPETYQLDGDVEGEFTRLTAEVVPGALQVVLSDRDRGEPGRPPGRPETS